MKQALKLFSLLLVTLSLTLVSCGDDNKTKDEPSEPTGQLDQQLVGIWQVVRNSDWAYSIELKADGTYIGYNIIGADYMRAEGKWDTTNGDLNFHYESYKGIDGASDHMTSWTELAGFLKDGSYKYHTANGYLGLYQEYDPTASELTGIDHAIWHKNISKTENFERDSDIVGKWYESETEESFARFMELRSDGTGMRFFVDMDGKPYLPHTFEWSTKDGYLYLEENDDQLVVSFYKYEMEGVNLVLKRINLDEVHCCHPVTNEK